MDDKLEVIRLYDRYSELLTARQRYFLNAYLLQDNSLYEIAELEGISKQAVFDSVRRSTSRLLEFERVLKCVAHDDALKRVEGELREAANAPLAADKEVLNEFAAKINAIWEDNYGV